MKILILFTTVIILSIPIQIFSQTKDELKSVITHLIQESVIQVSIPDDIIRDLTQSDIFKEGESRIIRNKIILEDGFLLIEELWQSWDGSNWMNYARVAYTYNGDNNLIEELLQIWVASNWVNESKNTYTYDGNNLIEELYQNWDSIRWVNDIKYTYVYDVNNKIESL